MESIPVSGLEDKKIHDGYMTKRSGGKVGNWRKRWFVLTNTKHLHYFVTDKDKRAKGVIDLSHYNEVIDIAGSWSKPFRFNLVDNTPNSTTRTFCFVTSSREQNDEWMTKIMQTITGKAKVPKAKRMSMYQAKLQFEPSMFASSAGSSSDMLVEGLADSGPTATREEVRAVAAYALVHEYLKENGACLEAEKLRERQASVCCQVTEDVSAPPIEVLDGESPYHSNFLWSPSIVSEKGIYHL